MSARGRRDESGDGLAERVDEIGRELERARFAGANPVLEVAAGASAFEVAAQVLAATRTNALLRLDGRDINLQEDRAAAELERALAALRGGGYSTAQGLLDRAGARAVDQALQQRIGLWKLLAQLVQRVVGTDPDEELRGRPERHVLELLHGADRLPIAEREHYGAEAGRLVALAASRTDPTNADGLLARTLWYLLRARVALANDEPVLALSWCVRTARENAARLTPDEYLGGLLDHGRRYVLLQLGEIPDDEAAATREAIKGLQAWDLYHALTARLSQLYGLDVHHETSRYSITVYHDVGASGAE